MIDLYRSFGDVALTIGLADVEQGIPGAEVGPAEASGHDPAFVGALHDRVVDRLGRRLGESLSIEEHGRADLLGLGDGFLGSGCHRGLEAGHFRQQQRGREQEIAAVPQQPLFDVAQGSLGVGFFHEGGDLHHWPDTLAAGTDVAVVGLGFRRWDAEGDDAALLDGSEAFAAAGKEFLGTDHQMVGRQRQHGLGAEPARVGSGGGHGGS